MNEFADLRVMTKVDNHLGTFVIECDRECLFATLTCPAPGQDLTREDLAPMVFEAGISFGLDEKALTRAVELARGGYPIEHIVIARGSPATPGEEGRLEFHKRPLGNPRSAEAGKEAAPDRVDHRERTGFDNLAEGDKIATYRPAVPGQGGTDILGRAIPVDKVGDTVIRVGENVRYAEDENAYYAMTHGLATFERNLLAVQTVYEIPGDLTLKEGNIRFVGRVDIRGDIGDGYQVMAAEGMHVGGTVDASTLISGADLTVEGGINGREKGEFRAKGVVHAHYISEAHVVAVGDVVVEREIVNSTVYTLGKVIVRSGSIMGGKTIALGGILAGSAGSEMGVRTTLASGLHYKTWERIRDLDNKLLHQQEKQQKLFRALVAIFDHAETEGGHEVGLREKVQNKMALAAAAEGAIRELEKEAGDLSEEHADKAVACVSVQGTTYPGVHIIVGRAERRFQSPLQGPMSVVPIPRQREALVESGIRTEQLWNGGDAADGPIPAEQTATSCKLPQEEKYYTYREIEERYKAFDPGGASARNQRILVADDQTNMRLLICKALTKRGYTPVEARDGKEALKLLLQGNLNCAILDIQMPGMNGLAVLKTIRKTSDMPIIICSGHKTKKEVLAAYSLGTNAYISKPFQMASLLDKVAELTTPKAVAEDASNIVEVPPPNEETDRKGATGEMPTPFSEAS